MLAKKVVTILILMYLALGLVSIGQNSSFHKSVKRCLDIVESNGPTIDLAAKSSDRNLNLCNPNTDDIKTKIHLNYLTWQYRSDERGYDRAIYLPADLVVLAACFIAIRLYSKKNKS